jgi:peptidoglycan hydrolase CwlO-like protein
MKTTIEMKGFEIVIEENEDGLITVSATKEGEVVESFELEEGENDDESMPFGEEESDFEGEEEIEEGEEEIEEGEEDIEEGEEEIEEGEEEIEEGEAKLESFTSFIRKRKK